MNFSQFSSDHLDKSLDYVSTSLNKDFGTILQSKEHDEAKSISIYDKKIAETVLQLFIQVTRDVYNDLINKEVKLKRIVYFSLKISNVGEFYK